MKDSNTATKTRSVTKKKNAFKAVKRRRDPVPGLAQAARALLTSAFVLIYFIVLGISYIVTMRPSFTAKVAEGGFGHSWSIEYMGAGVHIVNLFGYGAFILVVVCMAMSVYGIANGTAAMKTYGSNERGIHPKSTLGIAMAAVLLGVCGFGFEMTLFFHYFITSATAWLGTLFYIIIGGGILLTLIVIIRTVIGIFDNKNSGLPATKGQKANLILSIIVLLITVFFLVGIIIFNNQVGYSLSIIK